MANKEKKNTHIQGNIGLVTAIQHFGNLGCIICIPLNDIQDYDLVVDYEGRLIKVQVKTTYFKINNKYKVKLGGAKRFTENQSDYLFIVNQEGVKYFIPRDIVTASSGIVLGDNYSQYIVN